MQFVLQRLHRDTILYAACGVLCTQTALIPSLLTHSLFVQQELYRRLSLAEYLQVFATRKYILTLFNRGRLTGGYFQGTSKVLPRRQLYRNECYTQW